MSPLEKAGHGMVYGGSTSAFFFGLDANTVAAAIGVLIAAVGLAVTWHYQRKRDRREQAEHERRMAMYE